MSSDALVIEGTVPFSIPGAGKECFTWYKTIGSLSSPITPVIVIHGGPGLPHEYLISLSEFNKRFNIPMIFYDQVGNGRSTHLPEKNGDETFWTERLFIDELLNLAKALGLYERQGGYDVLGHSWGGMLAAPFAAVHPSGLRKLVISNAPATTSDWGSNYRRYRDAMPEDVKKVLYWEGEKMESGEYEGALMAFYKKHMCSVDPWPEEFVASFNWVKKDPTVTLTMNGPSEFNPTGSLEHWSAVEASRAIEVETLVIYGEEEGASGEAAKPFIDEIKHVKCVQMKGTRHMPMYEDPENYWKLVGEFLLGEKV